MSARPDPAGWPSLILGGLAADGDPLAYANSVVNNPEACSILKEAHSAMLAGDMPRVQKLRTDIDAVMSGPSGVSDSPFSDIAADSPRVLPSAVLPADRSDARVKLHVDLALLQARFHDQGLVRVVADHAHAAVAAADAGDIDTGGPMKPRAAEGLVVFHLLAMRELVRDTTLREPYKDLHRPCMNILVHRVATSMARKGEIVMSDSKGIFHAQITWMIFQDHKRHPLVQDAFSLACQAYTKIAAADGRPDLEAPPRRCGAKRRRTEGHC